MRRTTIVMGFVVVMLVFDAAWARQLRVATEGSYPPFNFVRNGEPTGFDVDIALALCAAMDVQCTVRTEPWKTILEGLAEGRYDMVVASIARTPERDRKVDFTEPYYRSRTNFIGDPTRLADSSKKLLAGKRLAAQKDTVQAHYLKRNYADVAEIRLYPTVRETYAALAKGETDAVLTDSLVAYEFLQSGQGERFDYIGPPLETSDPSSEACIAVREGDEELLRDLEKALRQIRLDGTYERINRAYFPFSIY